MKSDKPKTQPMAAPQPANKVAVDAGAPSAEFQAAAADVKAKRGRPPGSKAVAPTSAPTNSGSQQSAGAIWTPEAAAGFINALQMLPASFTGWGGWLLDDVEQKAIGPTAAAVFTEILPYDSYWLKLLGFAGALGAIEYKKMRQYAFYVAQVKAAKHPGPGPQAPPAPKIPEQGAPVAPAQPASSQKPPLPAFPGSAAF